MVWEKPRQKVCEVRGMEDVIFSGTSNKPSKNIAEVVLSLNNENKDGPHQYNELDEIEIRRKN